MSKTHHLKVNTRKRSGSGALKAMRREGFVPAVVYGAEQESINIKVGARSFDALLHGSASEQILVNLEIEEEGTTKLALIQDVQHNALNGQVVHVDFHAVRENELIHASVPVELIGDCTGVRKGGLLDQQLHSLEIQCFPKDLPEKVEGDVSTLDLGEAFHVNQLTFPEGVSALMDGEVVVALVAAPRVAADADADAATA
ncbi:MAG: 50S ribosomal protein L25/general stress protein Ctc [Verrucomicrobia bacterium]|nr:50S ribosomal protein L25/general stress protein Ctc [Verrucomicrobiota bacterium]